MTVFLIVVILNSSMPKKSQFTSSPADATYMSMIRLMVRSLLKKKE